MARRKTSRVTRSQRRSKDSRQVNLRPKTSRVFWSQTRRTSLRALKWLAILVVLGVGGFFGQREFWRVLLENEEFHLREVQIQLWESQEPPRLVDLQRIVDVTGLNPTASIFAFQLGEMEERLAELPEVKRVRATRRFPSVVRFKFEEREPVAWLESLEQGILGKHYQRGLLVDGEGFCFAPARAMHEVVRDLPVIATAGRSGEEKYRSGAELEGREVLRALELVKLSKRYFEDTGWSLPVVGLRNEFSLLAKTPMGASITIGLYDHERQLDDLLMILEHARKSDRGVQEVNLIPERNIPVVFAGSRAGNPAPEQALSPLERELNSILKRS